MEASMGRLGAFAAVWLLSAAAASAAEPCKLLTAQEVGQALGAPVSSTMPLGATGCMWKAGAQGVSLVVRPATAWPRITTPGPGIIKTNVSGLGDAASVSEMGSVVTLSVERGANVIVVSVNGVAVPGQQRSSEESLARLALLRL